MIVDQDTITFTYSNTATSERFTDTYYYKFDYEDNSFKLFTDASKADEYAVTPDDSTDHLAHTKNQKASIERSRKTTQKTQNQNFSFLFSKPKLYINRCVLSK